VAKIQKEVPLFLELYQRFLKTQCRIGGKTYKKKKLVTEADTDRLTDCLASTGATTINESVPIQYWHSARSLNWPFRTLKYIYIFQIKYTKIYGSNFAKQHSETVTV